MYYVQTFLFLLTLVVILENDRKRKQTIFCLALWDRDLTFIYIGIRCFGMGSLTPVYLNTVKLSEVYDTDILVVKVWPLNFYYEH